MTGLALWGILGEHEARSALDDDGEGLLEELMFEFGYSVGDSLLVVDGEDLFSPESVKATRAMVKSIEAIDGVRTVLSIDIIPRRAPLPFPVAVLPRDGADPEEFEEARAVALAHPLIAGQLSSHDGKTWVLPVILDEDRYLERTQDDDPSNVLDDLCQIIEEAKLPVDMEVALTGTLMIARESEEVFKREQFLYHGIAYVLVFLLATIMFRGFCAVILAGGGPVIGVLWTFGVVRLLGMEMSSLTLILLPIMIMMIGFTDSVHLMVHIRRERSRGRPPLEATRDALRLLTLPCFLTTLTTSLGFASLLIANSELVRDFGLACAIGVICTFLAVMSFLPFFSSSFVGRYLLERKKSSLVDGALPFMEHMNTWVMGHAKSITAIGCLLTLTTLVHGASIETENRVAADIPQSSTSAKALRRIESAMGGAVPLKVIVSWDEEHDQDGEAILAAMRAARGALDPEGLRSEPFALTNIVDFLSASGDGSGANLASLDLLPQGITDRVIHRELRAAPVDVMIPDRGYRHFEPMFERIEGRLAQLPAQHPGFLFRLGGQAVLSGRLFLTFTEDLIESLIYAALTIFLVLTLAFRSLRLGLISVIPNAFPLAMTASLLVLLDRPMAGATAFVMSLGIAVDDTIHFVTRFRHEFEQDRDLEAAIQRTVMRVGKALLMTTIVLVVGFSAVMTSDFPRNRVFSAMVVITIVSALVCDLVLLPAMLRTFLGKRWRATHPRA